MYSSDSTCVIDESKLSLAVYTPEVEPDEKKAVMVFIHGGGWQFGSAEMQNGAALAKYGDVVVVVLSYRYRFFMHVRERSSRKHRRKIFKKP